MNKTVLAALAVLILLASGMWWYGVRGTIGTVKGTSAATWFFDGTGWRVSGKPPACPSPLVMTTPVALKKATGILYPGQTRGGNYKPHGGFRFDTSNSADISVKAPMDAAVVAGSRYRENGEVQYLFEFIHPCGIMYRFDHLRVLSPKLAGIAATFPAPKEGDSRTTRLSSAVNVSTGEVLATAVGFAKNNTSVDWGVYDVRTKNAAAQNPTYAAQRDNQLAEHAICWFNVLSAADKATVKKLPAASENGKKSDYCR